MKYLNEFHDWFFLRPQYSLIVKMKLLVLAILILIIYFPSLFAPFYFDDFVSILDNPRIHQLSNILEIMKMYFTGRGLVQITLAVDWFIYSGQSYGFHLTNVFFHIAVTYLVYIITNKIWEILNFPKNNGNKYFDVGFFSALFFAVHTINTETVTYIISRSGQLATIVFLIFYFSSIHKFHILIKNESTIWNSLYDLLIISILIILGVFIGVGAKETIVTLPFIFLLTIWISYKKNWIFISKRLFVIFLPVIAGYFIYFLIRKFLMGGFFNFPDIEIRTPFENLLSQICVIAFYYIPRILYPIKLNIDPEVVTINSIYSAFFLKSFLVLFFLVFISLWMRRRKPIITLSIFWLFITLAPTSSFIPLFDLAAERRVYLPMIGISLLFGFAFYYLHMWKKQKAKFIIVTIIFIYLFNLSIFTFLRNLEFTNPKQIWYKSAILSPTKIRPFRHYLYYLIDEGNTKGAISAITREYKGVTIMKRNIDIDNLEFLIGFMIPQNLHVDYIVKIAEQFVLKYPKNLKTMETLQVAYLLTKRNDELEKIVLKTLEIHPRSVKSLQNLAYLYKIKGDNKKAIQILEETLIIKPDNLPVLMELLSLYKSIGINALNIEQKVNEIQKYKKLFYYGFVPSQPHEIISK